MEKHFLLCFLICLTFLVALGTRSTRLQAEPLTFSHIEAASGAPLSEAILREAYHALGISIEMEALPASRALTFANQGKTDGELFRIKIGPKYSNLIRIDEPLFQVEVMVFTKYVEFPVQGVESIRPYEIGIINGIKLVERLTQGMQVTKVTSGVQLIRMLDKKHIDIALLGRLSGLQYWKNTQVEGIKILEPPVDSRNVYHYLHKRHHALVPQVEQRLKQLRAEGTIQQIIDSFFNQS